MVRKAPLRPGKPLSRKTRLKRSTPLNPVNRERRKAERERAYGPKERREWLTRQPCVACGRVPTEDRPNHQHHTKGGGVGRKADADTLVSLCPKCHRKHHDGHELDVDWEREARRTNERWKAVSNAS